MLKAYNQGKSRKKRKTRGSNTRLLYIKGFYTIPFFNTFLSSCIIPCVLWYTNFFDFCYLYIHNVAPYKEVENMVTPIFVNFLVSIYAVAYLLHRHGVHVHILCLHTTNFCCVVHNILLFLLGMNIHTRVEVSQPFLPEECIMKCTQYHVLFLFLLIVYFVSDAFVRVYTGDIQEKYREGRALPWTVHWC